MHIYTCVSGPLFIWFDLMPLTKSPSLCVVRTQAGPAVYHLPRPCMCWWLAFVAALADAGRVVVHGGLESIHHLSSSAASGWCVGSDSCGTRYEARPGARCPAQPQDPKQYSSSWKLEASSLAKRNRSKATRFDKSELEQVIYIESSTLHMSFIIIRSSHLYIQRLKAE